MAYRQIMYSSLQQSPLPSCANLKIKLCNQPICLNCDIIPQEANVIPVPKLPQINNHLSHLRSDQEEHAQPHKTNTGSGRRCLSGCIELARVTALILIRNSLTIGNVDDYQWMMDVMYHQ